MFASAVSIAVSALLLSLLSPRCRKSSRARSRTRKRKGIFLTHAVGAPCDERPAHAERVDDADVGAFPLLLLFKDARSLPVAVQVARARVSAATVRRGRQKGLLVEGVVAVDRRG